jgi:hypothetical protein
MVRDNAAMRRLMVTIYLPTFDAWFKELIHDPPLLFGTWPGGFVGAPNS